ncbi:MAG TPA: DUF4159 domain-containing protein [Terriglobia bacterium]|nr:DUF4159 domain-containing protein [Terriglobia bacterium]
MRLAAVAVLAALGIAASLFSQEHPEFQGRYEDAALIEQPKDDTTQLVFVRLIYNGITQGYYKNWYTDYPKAGTFLVPGVERLTNLNIELGERAIALNDPELFRYPLIYTSEPEQMLLTREDAGILREYLTRGGFWIMDDNWGGFDMARIEQILKRVLPDRKIENIPMSHPLFHSFYDVDKLIQTPSTAYLYNGGVTWETDGFNPECKGVFDDEGRLMVVINHNTDLGDAYENADVPGYPVPFTVYGYKLAINMIIYGLTH